MATSSLVPSAVTGVMSTVAEPLTAATVCQPWPATRYWNPAASGRPLALKVNRPVLPGAPADVHSG
jgi:hypothetical protein